MISNILFYRFYPIYIIPVINVQKNAPKFHTTYFYNTHFYIPVISALPCFYIPVSQKKCQFIPTFVNTSSNIIVRGPNKTSSRFIEAVPQHITQRKLKTTWTRKTLQDWFLDHKFSQDLWFTLVWRSIKELKWCSGS